LFFIFLLVRYSLIFSCRRYVLKLPNWQDEPEPYDDMLHRRHAEKMAKESGYEPDLFVKKVEVKKARAADDSDRFLMESNPVWNATATTETGYGQEGDTLEVVMNPLMQGQVANTRLATAVKGPTDVEMTTFKNNTTQPSEIKDDAKPQEVTFTDDHPAPSDFSVPQTTSQTDSTTTTAATDSSSTSSTATTTSATTSTRRGYGEDIDVMAGPRKRKEVD
jgi:hypothetical protein